MPVLRDIGLLATCRPEGAQHDLHALPAAALAWQGDTLAWVGPEADLPDAFQDDAAYSAGGRLVVPGLVDCHTHLAFGGWRADEFEMRVRGRSYLDIARAGGGILSTVRATRAASEDELYETARRRLAEMATLGVTTVEAKSGYGLTVEDELKLLRVYRRLQQTQPVRVVPTFLGAHTVPPEYADRREAYVELVLREMLPAVAAENLARFCDVFVEETAFTVQQARRILVRGKALGLAPKLHADQLSDGGGGLLAEQVGATSADHLEYTRSPEGLARAGVVAVSLPLASFYLRQRPMRARAFLRAGGAVAVATDFNPGSAPSYHLPLAMTMACVMQDMTPAEVLKGATVVAARAAGMEAEVGSLEAGKKADFAVVDAPDVNHWLYHFRASAVVQTFIGGQPWAT